MRIILKAAVVIVVMATALLFLSPFDTCFNTNNPLFVFRLGT